MRIVIFAYKMISVLAAMTFAVTAMSATIAAKKDGVKVFDRPSKRANVILKLKKGQALEASERSGMYWRVQVEDSKTGYVAFMKVRRKASSSSALSNAIKDAAHKSRDMDGVKTARSRSAVMGVRGLDESSETAYAGNTTPNLRMVYAMEDRQVSAKKIRRHENLIMEEVGKRYNDE